MTHTIEKLDGSEARITLHITSEEIGQYYNQTLQSIVSQFEMDGFRRGTVPEKIVVQKLGSMKIWQEALQNALPNLYIAALTESKIPAIGRPTFVITKIADRADAEVVATTAILPEFELPKLKPIAEEVYKNAHVEPVTDEQLDAAILELRKLRHFQESRNEKTYDSHSNIPEDELPEMSDEYLKGFGSNVSDMDSLRTHMRHNLEHEAIHHFEDKKRAELVEKLLDATPFSVPTLLIEHEIDNMIRQYEHELSMSGVSLDDYLSFTQKTRDSLREDVRVGAEKRAKTQLIVEKIAEIESIKPDATKVSAELEAMKSQYKDHKDFSEPNAKSYLEQIYTNQAVFKYLEDLGGFVSHNHEEWSKVAGE